MKRLSLLFALSIVLLSFGLANAVEFDVEVNPATQFVHPSDLNTYYMGNTATYLDIKIGGTPGDGDLGGYSETHQFYSPTGGSITWGTSGADLGGAMDRMNGWEDATYWGMLNQVVGFSFNDGILPDTMNHTTASITGMTDTEPILTRMRFYLTVPTSGTDPLTDIVEICIDQANGSDPTYDWLFPVAAPFGGPYCFQFLTVPNLPPEIDPAPPLSMSTEHDVAFSFTGTLTDAEDDPITDVKAFDETDTEIPGAITFGGGSSFDFSFDPPCSWVTDGLSHSVTFKLYDNVHGHMPGSNTYTVSLTATNTAPAISVCPDPLTAAVDADAIFDFDATDGNVGDDQNWSVTVDMAPDGPYDINPATGLFTFTPTSADDGNDYTFTITVTDCAGATDDCDWVISPMTAGTFGIAIEYEDGNADGEAKDGIDGLGHYLGQHAGVSVFKINGAAYMYGFDFLIGYDNSALALFGVYPSSEGLFDCWEYFTWRFVNNCGGSCPSGLVQVVAIADQNDGNPFDEACADVSNTSIADPTQPYELFNLDFFVSNDYTLECSFIPIYFYWTDCGDNSIAFRTGTMTDPLCRKQAVSNVVYSPISAPEIPYNVVDPTSGGFAVLHDPNVFPNLPGEAGDPDFPTTYGTPWGQFCNPIPFGDPATDACEGTAAKAPVRLIDFFNGGVKIICNNDIDARGDVNLNGVFNEIADAVVFTNYFIYGMNAFTINEEGQKAATDVNADGIPLSVADLVYLVRVITGDILPIPKLSPNAVEAHFGQDGQLVTVDVELGAALFVLEGNVDVNLAQGASSMQIKSNVVNGNTRVLVYSFEKGATFSGNVLNTEGKVISVEAADYYGSAYKTVVLPTTFSVQNYPNPFNPATTIEMALPVATNWNLTIYNVAGQKVAEFAGFAEAGINNVVWDASASASGIYFYKVTTDEGSMTKKMVLLK